MPHPGNPHAAKHDLSFEIIPAVDILGGRCVRLAQGDYHQATVFSDDPVKVAVGWEQQGAKRLHVVDLDGAKEGRMKNQELVEAIVRSIPIPVQVGGGIREFGLMEKLLSVGVDRVVVGSQAVEDPVFIKNALKQFRNRIVVGLDSKDGRIATHGWTQTVARDRDQWLSELAEAGLERIIYTDISRDGMLTGPDVEGIQKLAQGSNLKIIASGGIRSLDDIRILNDLFSCGVEGCIIGRALYTGAIHLRDALRITV